jgi:hypothetical protein
VAGKTSFQNTVRAVLPACTGTVRVIVRNVSRSRMSRPSVRSCTRQSSHPSVRWIGLASFSQREQAGARRSTGGGSMRGSRIEDRGSRMSSTMGMSGKRSCPSSRHTLLDTYLITSLGGPTVFTTDHGPHTLLPCRFRLFGRSFSAGA